MGNFISLNIFWLDTIDSTNSEALRRLAELPSMTVLAAREQTAGRGQRGNTWFTRPGQNLTFSIVLKYGPDTLPALSASHAVWLNYLCSQAVVLFLRSFGVLCRVKWPNDVYVGKRKICGILIENHLASDGLAASVLGIGININQREFPQLAKCYFAGPVHGQGIRRGTVPEAVSGLFRRTAAATVR